MGLRLSGQNGLVEIHAADFADYLGPDQVAVGITASVEKLVFGIRALLERRPDFACWQIDLRNAFNQFQRALLPGRFAEAPPRLRRLLPFVCALLGPGAPLTTGIRLTQPVGASGGASSSSSSSTTSSTGTGGTETGTGTTCTAWAEFESQEGPGRTPWSRAAGVA